MSMDVSSNMLLLRKQATLTFYSLVYNTYVAEKEHFPFMPHINQKVNSILSRKEMWTGYIATARDKTLTSYYNTKTTHSQVNHNIVKCFGIDFMTFRCRWMLSYFRIDFHGLDYISLNCYGVNSHSCIITCPFCTILRNIIAYKVK